MNLGYRAEKLIGVDDVVMFDGFVSLNVAANSERRLRAGK